MTLFTHYFTKHILPLYLSVLMRPSEQAEKHILALEHSSFYIYTHALKMLEKYSPCISN